MAKCIVCEANTSGSLEFCRTCYKNHKEDIIEKKPWVKALKNESQRQRRARERELRDESLDAIMDSYYTRNERY